MSLTVALRHRLGHFDMDVAFDAPPGLTVLYGRSGSGKTTIINAVAGLLRPDAGRIAVDGRVLFDSEARVCLPPHKRRLGYIVQDARLFPHLTVRQNLLYGRHFAPEPAPEARIDHVVEMLGIGPLLARRPGRLSGGERQRVAIGRALLASPRLILADEPLAALDEARKAEILPYFERLRDEVATPILYVSHAPNEVARLATEVIALQDGRVVGQGSATELLGDPGVTPLGAGAAGAVLEVRVVDQHADGLTELEAPGGLRLLVPEVEAPAGTRLRVQIAAQDVMLATREPRDISALNIFRARVRTLRMGDGPGALVQLDAGGDLMLSRITRRSVTTLGLREGQEVFAIIKAVSVAKDAIARARRADG